MNVITRKDESIDPSKTINNYSLLNEVGKCNPHKNYDRYINKLKEINVLNRNDVHTVCEAIFSLPKNLEHLLF